MTVNALSHLLIADLALSFTSPVLNEVKTLAFSIRSTSIQGLKIALFLGHFPLWFFPHISPSSSLSSPSSSPSPPSLSLFLSLSLSLSLFLSFSP